jgi:hypothetical protein
MRRLILFMHMSVDGYVAAAGQATPLGRPAMMALWTPWCRS